jgi:phospholipid transport system substrate-binding protein
MKRLLKNLLVFSVLIYTLPAVYASSNPEMLVKDAIFKVFEELRQQTGNLEKNPTAVYKLVDEIILPHFDFKKMSKLVLSKNWRKINQDEKNRFTSEFHSLLVRTYTEAIVDYVDETIKIFPSNFKNSDKRTKVRTRVKNIKTGKDINIVYKMYYKQKTWKVYDIMVENVSLVINYRSGFDSDIKKFGINSLIDSLFEKNTLKK